MRNLLLTLSFIFFQSMPIFAKTLKVEEVLSLIEAKSERSQINKLTLEAKEAEIKARDLDLATTFDAEAAAVDEHRRSLSGKPHSLSRYLDASISKALESGTNLSLRGGYEWAESHLIDGHRHISDWEVEASQSFLRNGFGEAIRLRREQGNLEKQVLIYDVLYDKQALLADLESLYWDLTLLWQEEKVLNENLTRSRRLEDWIKKRIQLRAAETSDLLQVQSLIAKRQLELEDVYDRKQNIYNRLQAYSEGLVEADWQPDLTELAENRNLTKLLASSLATNQKEPASGQPAGPQRLDVLANQQRLAQAKIETQRIEDNQKPDLQAFLKYGQNGVREGFDDALTDSLAPRYTGSTLGLRFSMTLDKNLQAERRKVAEMGVAIAEMELASRQRGANLDWEELNRRLQTYEKRIKQAKKLLSIHRNKIGQERQRYEQGRSTVFQVINFEVDAANAELAVHRLLAEMRKIEALARFFIAERL